MRHPLFAFPLMLLGFTTVVSAQTKAAKEIEAELKRQINSSEGSTTTGMTVACHTAAGAYAKEIGRVYRKLEKGLPEIQRNELIRGQLAWQDYLATYRRMTDHIYDALGTIHRPMAEAALKEMLRHRLEELCVWFMRTGDPLDEEIPDKEAWSDEECDTIPDEEDDLATASQAAKPKDPAKKSE